MNVYHRTFHSAAILQEGFRDATGYYMNTQEFLGVWVSDRPLNRNEGADENVLLALEIPEELFVEYDRVREASDGEPWSYRESLILAKELNQFRKTLRVGV
jgi:hypothetical protein